MLSSWSDKAFDLCVKEYSPAFGADVAQLTYITRLVGGATCLALHGGGNTSIKSFVRNVFNETIPALFVKASGCDMASIAPTEFVALDGEYLKKLKTLTGLSDEDMAAQFRMRYLLSSNSLPSIETLMHAFLPALCIVHTHPEAILALTNRNNAKEILGLALGNKTTVIPYVKVGFDLAIAASQAFEADPAAGGIVIMHHGLVTWGKTAKEAYEKTIAIVNNAENYLLKAKSKKLSAKTKTTVDEALSRYTALAPIVRGALSQATGNPDMPYQRIILRPLLHETVLDLLGAEAGKAISLTTPLTPDYLIRTKTIPLWVDATLGDDPTILRNTLTKAIAEYSENYNAYLLRNGLATLPEGFDALPKVVLMPGIGAVCVGESVSQADMARDITNQALSVKKLIHETNGTYEGLSEEHLFDMEFRSFQRAKLSNASAFPLKGTVVLVTGAAGAIGTGICQSLLEAGCHVAATDLPGPNLDALVKDLDGRHDGRIIGAAMDVTDEASVAWGFDRVIEQWGGVDGVIVNAGIAHVSTLETMDLETFRKLERVNVDGTLLVIREAARLFRLQNTGGDIVLISTKNVFAPGAQFGAYSATKAASHQLARIAILELAGIGVRVNMVAPDAVFSHGDKKSGLWAEVGPNRMKARGLDEKGLEEYYQSRNLLKAAVTARHVANAVLFFLTHQTPTTGATIPVDGGLPDATPR
jgi:rhamnose utilization protein RhaD (predicted bifunctional aldolase and dehydrogenase)/NAD(P)-dependent dehydrogenase (short-subunit alcohol dehydrogenase family)